MRQRGGVSSCDVSYPRAARGLASKNKNLGLQGDPPPAMNSHEPRNGSPFQTGIWKQTITGRLRLRRYGNAYAAPVRVGDVQV